MQPTDFHQLLVLAEAQPQRRVDPTQPVWIFGAGGFGQALAGTMQAQGSRVAGFVETWPRSTQVQGLPVLDWSQLQKMQGQADLALGIFNRGLAFDTLLKIAAGAGFAAPHMPWTLYEQFGPSLGWRYWLSGRQVLQDGLDRIARVSEGLADAESVQTLYRICAFRLGLDTGFASVQSSDAPYFNALTLANLRARAITYVDCGAYNGDTYFDLLDEPGIDCSQAFLLEPDPANFDALVQRVAQRKAPAVCLPLAVSNRHESLMFNGNQGEASAVQHGLPASGSGQTVTAVSLDQLLPSSRIDLLKLDVEGGEALALEGARQVIQRSRPVLAVSLYHQPHDLWELPELLFDLCPRYQFYVRQHGFNTFDSVLYAVPDSPG